MLRQLASRHTQTTDVDFPTVQTHLKEWHNLRYSLRIPRVLEEDAQVVDNFLLQDRQTKSSEFENATQVPGVTTERGSVSTYWAEGQSPQAMVKSTNLYL